MAWRSYNEAHKRLKRDVEVLRTEVERLAAAHHGDHETRKLPADWRKCAHSICAGAVAVLEDT